MHKWKAIYLTGHFSGSIYCMNMKLKIFSKNKGCIKSKNSVFSVNMTPGTTALLKRVITLLKHLHRCN